MQRRSVPSQTPPASSNDETASPVDTNSSRLTVPEDDETTSNINKSSSNIDTTANSSSFGIDTQRFSATGILPDSTGNSPSSQTHPQHLKHDTASATPLEVEPASRRDSHIVSAPPRSALHKAHLRQQQQAEQSHADPQRHWFRHHALHCLILTHSARPVWTRHGSDQKLNSLMAVAQALIENWRRIHCHNTNNNEASQQQQHQQLHHVRTRTHTFLFQPIGALTILVIARHGTAFGHRLPSLLALSRLAGALYLQLLSVTTVRVQQVLQQQPGYDVRSQLAGTEALMRTMCDTASHSHQVLFGALSAVRLDRSSRQRCTQHLKRAIATAALQQQQQTSTNVQSPLVFAALLTASSVLAVARSAAQKFVHPHDLLVVQNLIRASVALNGNLDSTSQVNSPMNASSDRSAEALSPSNAVEVWIPICLPVCDANHFSYLYCTRLVSMSQQLTTTRSHHQHQFELLNSLDDECEESQSESLFIVLLSSASDAFDSMRQVRSLFVESMHADTQLQQQSSLTLVDTVRQSLASHCSPDFAAASIDISTLGLNSQCPQLRHFVYHAVRRSQVVSSHHVPPYSASLRLQRRITRAIQHSHAAVHGDSSTSSSAAAASPLNQNASSLVHCHWHVNDELCAVLCLHRLNEYELYCVFTPDCPMAQAHAAAQQVIQYIDREENSLFLQ